MFNQIAFWFQMLKVTPLALWIIRMAKRLFAVWWKKCETVVTILLTCHVEECNYTNFAKSIDLVSWACWEKIELEQLPCRAAKNSISRCRAISVELTTYLPTPAPVQVVWRFIAKHDGRNYVRKNFGNGKNGKNFTNISLKSLGRAHAEF